MRHSIAGFLDYYRGIDWRRLIRRVWVETWDDDVFGHAAQLSYFLLFSLFPILLIMTVILAYVAEGSEMREALIGYFGRVLPGAGYQLVSRTLDGILQNAGGGKLSIGIVTTLWAASSGMTAIIEGLNKAYEVREERPWWKARIVAAALTVGMTLLTVVALALLLYGPRLGGWLADSLGFGAVFETVWTIARWLLTIVFVVIGFLLVYRFAPNLETQKWHWMLPGAGVAVSLWLLLSLGLRLYLAYFPAYTNVYGSLGAALILLLWLYLSSAALLIGGEVNSEIENAAARNGRTDAKFAGEKAPRPHGTSRK